MAMTTRQKLDALREQMRQFEIQAYIVPTDDYHASEYVGDYFKAREYLSGFTGSAGTLVVLGHEAALWTDGRYFLQAADQLADSGITLMKSGQSCVPEIPDYLAEKLPEGAVVGFDGRTVSHSFVERLRRALDRQQIRYEGGVDLVDRIWTDRPPMSKQPVFELPVCYAGMSREEKLAQLRSDLAEAGADACLISALDEIAWLLNLRGADIAYTPVFLAYLIVEPERAVLCAHREILSEELISKLAAADVALSPYESVEALLGGLPAERTLLIDAQGISERLIQCIPETVRCIPAMSPVTRRKAVKTPQEMEHERVAHIRDGVAVTRFIYWLKHNVAGGQITEMGAAGQLERFRKEQKNYLYESFAPIIAYGAHGAIVHYEATAQTDATLEAHGLCLADTGGHYLEGTTDITRTIALGALTDEEIRAFTSVLRGHLNLAAARFPEGICGQNLDILARMPLWEQGLDFNHGTGHGVGYLLSVHEGPQRIHWRLRSGQEVIPFEEGMIVSDEPGLYMEGKFGIRHENLLLCRRDESNEYGQFLRFEPLTMVPFDRDAIDVAMLTQPERQTLNAYHARVYETLQPYFEGEELKWLAEVTAPL